MPNRHGRCFSPQCDTDRSAGGPRWCRLDLSPAFWHNARLCLPQLRSQCQDRGRDSARTTGRNRRPPNRNVMSMSAAVTVYNDLSPAQLIEQALARNEGQLTDSGALVVTTGKPTGRSPKDRFVVKDATTADTVDWGPVNQPFEPSMFAALW